MQQWSTPSFLHPNYFQGGKWKYYQGWVYLPLPPKVKQWEETRWQRVMKWANQAGVEAELTVAVQTISYPLPRLDLLTWCNMDSYQQCSRYIIVATEAYPAAQGQMPPYLEEPTIVPTAPTGCIRAHAVTSATMWERLDRITSNPAINSPIIKGPFELVRKPEKCCTFPGHCHKWRKVWHACYWLPEATTQASVSWQGLGAFQGREKED